MPPLSAVIFHDALWPKARIRFDSLSVRYFAWMPIQAEDREAEQIATPLVSIGCLIK
jgi:hypothetical protein